MILHYMGSGESHFNVLMIGVGVGGRDGGGGGEFTKTLSINTTFEEKGELERN